MENVKLLKELREDSNYIFGYSHNLIENLKNASEITDNNFDEVITIIHRILDLTKSRFRFQTSIGDNFGDDIIDTYISGEQEEKVYDFLVFNNLTT